jgi:hypothetical protein
MSVSTVYIDRCERMLDLTLFQSRIPVFSILTTESPKGTSTHRRSINAAPHPTERMHIPDPRHETPSSEESSEQRVRQSPNRHLDARRQATDW